MPDLKDQISQRVSGEQIESKKEDEQFLKEVDASVDTDQSFVLVESHINHFKIDDISFDEKKEQVTISMFGKISNHKYRSTFTCNIAKFPFAEDVRTLMHFIQEALQEQSAATLTINQEEKCFLLTQQVPIAGNKTKDFQLRGEILRLKPTPENEMYRLNLMIEELSKRIERVENGLCVVGQYKEEMYNPSTTCYFNHQRPLLVPFNATAIVFRKAYNLSSLNTSVSTQGIEFVSPSISMNYYNVSYDTENILRDIDRLVHLESIQIFRDSMNVASRERLIEQVSCMPNLKDFYCENYEASNLQGEGLPSLMLLESITIVDAPKLENASNYLQLYPKLKKLTFKSCPKIIANDKAHLEDICAKRGITLVLS